MRRFRPRRPSPAMAVALTALFLSLGGGAYALTLPTGSVGPAQLRRSAVLNSRIFPGGVSNSKMGKGAVTFSKMANNQMTSAKMRNGSLLGEDLAGNTITGAQINESTLDITRWALVSASGEVTASSGGVTSGGQVGSTTFVNFGSSMAGRPILATINGQPAGGGQVTAAPCGGASSTNPGAITCAGALNSPNVVAVSTFGGDGKPAGMPFYVSVPQA
jgi:hypothetical protein